MKSKSLLTAVILLAMPFSSALASEGLNSGDTAWMFAEWRVDKKPTVLGLASGVVAGLVAITPAACG
jgi:ammonia channel protein AmtB